MTPYGILDLLKNSEIEVPYTRSWFFRCKPDKSFGFIRVGVSSRKPSAVYFDMDWFVVIIRVVRKGSKLCNQPFRTALRNVEIGGKPKHAWKNAIRSASVVCLIECAA